MKGQITEISKGKNYTAMDVGAFADLLNYTESKGKVFIKDSINSTGTEISFQLLPAGTELPFFHSHKQNEEIYIVLKGKGQMQIDGTAFHLTEGSVVRVAPEGNRSLKSAADSEMVYMVIQAKEKSLEQCTATDGVLTQDEAKWLK
ncbi:mannose-6-phosphate isomerase-like protein (cupin superfamily) [Elusimicrobium posterum]|uniref:cupin domain-containing protein n=1 Tax=Elusimicrobium posterum TaxID=3116653 RepID=UPI003C77FE1C